MCLCASVFSGKSHLKTADVKGGEFNFEEETLACCYLIYLSLELTELLFTQITYQAIRRDYALPVASR